MKKKTLKPPPPPVSSRKRERPAPTKKVKPAPDAFSLQTLATLYSTDSPKRETTPPPPPPPLRAEIVNAGEEEVKTPQQVPKPLYGDDVVVPISRLLKQYHARSHLELEAKLGKCNGDGSFASGVSEASFSLYLSMLESYRGWPLPQWKYSFDYILKNQVRCTKSSSGHAFVRKSLVEHVTLRCGSRPYDIRFSLKEEVPTEVRVPGEPTLIRVKKRKSFVYKDKLQFDLTIVWTGATEQEAHDSDPTFEVELECINKTVLGKDHAYVASSMVEKMLDFLGRDPSMGPIVLCPK